MSDNSAENTDEIDLSKRVHSLTLVLSILFVIGMCFALFFKNGVLPSGFYIDEAAGIIHAICISEHGHDAWDEKSFPLFFPADTGGIHSPIFVYLNAVWGSLFGFSIASLRTLGGLITVFTMLGAVSLMKRLCGKDAACITLILVVVSPWAYQYSRIAWDNYLFPCLTVWGVVTVLSPSSFLKRVISPLLFAASAYSYGSARVQVPLILFFGIIFFWKRFSWKDIIAFVLVFSFSCIPMLHATLYGRLSERAAYVSIFGDYFWQRENLTHYRELMFVFFENVYKHLTLNFLVIEGDHINGRHGTRELGVLSWPDMLGLLCVPITVFLARGVHMSRRVMFFILCGIFAGIAPAAMTWDSLPHSLRSSGAWPFFSCLSAWSLTILIRRNYFLYTPTLLLSISFAVFFMHRYHTRYPETSKGWFDYHVYESAQVALESGDWKGFSDKGWPGSLKRYYLHEFAGISCKESRSM